MQHIQTILTQIEQTKNIKILYACETGSRAWGFPSPDSDYDVRFIYQHQKDWYLSLSQHKDTIEYMVDETWDVTGWDLKKSLLLLKKSNAALIERFQSPIMYYGDETFKNEFKELVTSYYSPTAVFFHHYSLAKNFWEELKDANEIKLKSYFYLIRSLLSCHWIIKDKSVLPMHIEGLMVLIDSALRDKLRQLIQLKAGVSEKYMHPKDEELHQWITDLWELVEANKENLGVNGTDMKQLNAFFLKTIQ
jgi:uncharacterized protein